MVFMCEFTLHYLNLPHLIDLLGRMIIKTHSVVMKIGAIHGMSEKKSPTASN